MFLISIKFYNLNNQEKVEGELYIHSVIKNTGSRTKGDSSLLFVEYYEEV